MKGGALQSPAINWTDQWLGKEAPPSGTFPRDQLTTIRRKGHMAHARQNYHRERGLLANFCHGTLRTIDVWLVVVFCIFLRRPPFPGPNWRASRMPQVVWLPCVFVFFMSAQPKGVLCADLHAISFCMVIDVLSDATLAVGPFPCCGHLKRPNKYAIQKRRATNISLNFLFQKASAGFGSLKGELSRRGPGPDVLSSVQNLQSSLQEPKRNIISTACVSWRLQNMFGVYPVIWGLARGFLTPFELR